VKRAILLLLAASTLAAAPGAAILTDDVYQLEPGDWRWIRFDIRQRPATVVCNFETVGAQGPVRAELVSRRDLERIRQRKSHDPIAETPIHSSGVLNRYIQDPGEYAALIENKGTRPMTVHLVVSLSFTPPKPVARTLTPTRRLSVILISFVSFFAIVTFSARALLRAMKRS
jgi:hypothetical protein